MTGEEVDVHAVPCTFCRARPGEPCKRHGRVRPVHYTRMEAAGLTQGQQRDVGNSRIAALRVGLDRNTGEE